MKFLPIGSVIKFENKKLIVAGHAVNKLTNKYSYVVAPYPYGYMGEETLLKIKVNAKFEVLYEGYNTEQGEKYLQDLDTLSELTPAQILFANSIIREALERNKEVNKDE